jgi:hypothetical protein
MPQHGTSGDTCTLSFAQEPRYRSRQLPGTSYGAVELLYCVTVSPIDVRFELSHLPVPLRHTNRATCKYERV